MNRHQIAAYSSSNLFGTGSAKEGLEGGGGLAVREIGNKNNKQGQKQQHGVIQVSETPKPLD